MDPWVLIVIVLVMVIFLGLIFKNVIKKKTSTELLLLSIVLILTGGFLLIQPIINTNTILVSLGGLGLVLFGFIVGILGFFKN